MMKKDPEWQGFREHSTRVPWRDAAERLESIGVHLGRNARTIRVYCANCGCLLYKYQKAEPGRLVRCFQDRIVEDRTRGDLRCPSRGQEFARETMAYGRPANKIIQGKVTGKG